MPNVTLRHGNIGSTQAAADEFARPLAASHSRNIQQSIKYKEVTPDVWHAFGLCINGRYYSHW
jgi:hypothetical protein